MDIPLPPTGHWQKVAHHKKTSAGKFIERNPDREKIHLKLRDPDQEKVKPFKATSDTFPGLNFKVFEKLIDPDKLVVSSEKILKSSAAEHQKRNPGHTSLINCWQGLSIYVSPPLFDRALCFMDALIKIIKQRRHTVTLDQGTCVMIGEQKVKVALREKTTRIKNLQITRVQSISQRMLSKKKSHEINIRFHGFPTSREHSKGLSTRYNP